MGSRVAMLVLLVVVAPLLASQTQQFLKVDTVRVGAAGQLPNILAGTAFGALDFSNSSLVQHLSTYSWHSSPW